MGRRGVIGSIFTGTLALSALAAVPSAQASGHGDAPLASQDPQTQLANVYAFVGLRYDDPAEEVLNVLVQVRPFSVPGAGGVFPRFADDALYHVHLADPTTGATLVRYDFAFSDVDPQDSLADPDTILSYGRGTQLGPILAIGDARQNYVQTYRVERRVAKAGKKKVKLPKKGETLAEDLPVAPPNVGKNVTPAYNDPTTGAAISGATTFAELDAYTAQAIQPLQSGEVAFAGTREDAFYGDLPAVFDLLDPRLLAPDGTGQFGGGPDAFADFDALSFALQIPLTRLPPAVPFTDMFGTPASGIGIYASVSRGDRKLKKSGLLVSKPPKVQVARMANPLLNLLLLPLRWKDDFHRTRPEDDARFGDLVRAPELAELLNQRLATAVQAANRGDLASLFLPDVLRVDTTTGPVRLPGQTGFSRLSSFGGDTAAGHPAGWPNGRRPGDDVVDILLTALASGPAYVVTSPLGDNVAANDQLYHQVFPYLGTPHSGTNP